MFPPGCSEWEFVEPQFFSFLQKACTLLYKYAVRDEVRRLTRENASDNEKKNDTAYTYVKIAHSFRKGAGSY